MSSDDSQSEKECPLCMEAFDIDDINFFPCNCQYQICRFCWHRIRTNENGLCPACRQSYPEDPVNFQPLSSAELQKIKTEKKQKVQQQKNKLIESRKHLSEFRVLQKNLVYAVGLSQRMADPELLKKPEFFGKFGKIIKIAVGTAQAINSNTPPTHTAYVTYARSDDALRAIQAVNNMVLDGRLLKASLGTTKYCSNFLKGQACYKPECMYLHEVAEEEISFTKEDMHQGKHTEYERRLHEQMMGTTGQQGASNSYQNSGREMLKNRTNGKNADLIEKKRPITVGSAENLVKIAQKQKKSGSAGTSSQKGTSTWDEHKIGRGGSETRELRRNESGTAIVQDTKRNSKASVKSVSPPTVSSAETSSKNREESGSSNNNTAEVKNTSPVSMSFSIGEPMAVTAGARSDSNPPPMLNNSISSPSPPIAQIAALELNGITVENNVHTEAFQSSSFLENGPTQQQQLTAETDAPTRTTSSSINFFLDHDDDLGFDPFAESAKALEEIMEEEKHYTPPKQQENGIGATGSLFTNNTLYGHHHGHQPPPPGLHEAFSMRSAFDGNGSSPRAFSMFGNNKLHDNDTAISMSDLRESFKAMLPNVNVRFASTDQNNEHHSQHPQGVNHFGGTANGYFGAIGSNNTSTSSLPTMPSGHPRATAATTNNNYHFRPFSMDASQHLQQHQQQQQRGFTHPGIHQSGRQPNPYQNMGSGQQMNNFGNATANGPFHPNQQPYAQQTPPSPYSSVNSHHHNNISSGSSPFGNALSPLQQHQQQQSAQNHHYFGMGQQQQHNNYSSGHPQQQLGAGNGSGQFQMQAGDQSTGGWLPVPPGFTPRTGQH